jgi:hypothetical protein
MDTNLPYSPLDSIGMLSYYPTYDYIFLIVSQSQPRSKPNYSYTIVQNDVRAILDRSGILKFQPTPVTRCSSFLDLELETHVSR